jgi:hypothetical protein
MKKKSNYWGAWIRLVAALPQQPRGAWIRGMEGARPPELPCEGSWGLRPWQSLRSREQGPGCSPSRCNPPTNLGKYNPPGLPLKPDACCRSPALAALWPVNFRGAPFPWTCCVVAACGLEITVVPIVSRPQISVQVISAAYLSSSHCSSLPSSAFTCAAGCRFMGALFSYSQAPRRRNPPKKSIFLGLLARITGRAPPPPPLPLPSFENCEDALFHDSRQHLTCLSLSQPGGAKMPGRWPRCGRKKPGKTTYICASSQNKARTHLF